MSDPAAGGRDPDVTVVIPTLDGARYLDRVLTAVEGQDLDGDVEILVIDSGSSDGTLEIVAAHPRVRLHRIPRAEFGHGRTRRLGAELASGRVVAYLTQDAIPAGPDWLRRLIAPLEDPRVAGVVGRQIPRAGCFPLLKYEIVDTFRALGPDDATTILELPEGADDDDLDRLAFYSDVNAASRRHLLVSVIPYRDVPYSEDLAFARDALRAGYRTAYAGEAAVIHSNDLTLREYRERVAEEIASLRRTGVGVRRHGPGGRLLRIGRGVLRDSVRIVRDPGYTVAQRMGWLIRDPAYQVAKWSGYARGFRPPAPGTDTVSASPADTLDP